MPLIAETRAFTWSRPLKKGWSSTTSRAKWVRSQRANGLWMPIFSDACDCSAVGSVSSASRTMWIGELFIDSCWTMPTLQMGTSAVKK